MVLTEERKIYMKEYNKEYHQKNKVKLNEQKKEYRQKNKELIKEQSKEHMKEYRQKNKDKINEYQKEYRQTPNGIKSRIIAGWKTIGLIHDNFDELYEKYINTTNCDVCNKTFKNTKDRCLDHNHNTGQFRYVLCQSCNVKDNWKNKC